MFESLFSVSSVTSDFSIVQLCISCCFALMYGAVLSFAYCFRSRYSRDMIIAIVLIPAVVALVIALVNGNVGAGIAVAGAFSLVRFRSAPGSARDIAIVFLAMGVGLACGMGYVAIAGIACVILSVALVLVSQFSGKILSDNNSHLLRITVPEDLDYDGVFEDVLSSYMSEYFLQDVRTTNMGSLYRLTYDVVLKQNVSTKSLLDDIRIRNGNLEVALMTGVNNGTHL